MSAAKASGADTSNGSASKSRDHNQGNQDRKYTIEQKAAVIRVRRCQPTAFYDILGLEEVKTTVSETEIKKAYRKISLLTHPDKNGHEHADEAFKMVSRAFGVLGDKEKKDKYDRYGGDPDSRGGGQPSQSPFSGFSGRSPAAGGGGGGRSWDDEISPEEMFNRFFGGGGMGGGFGGFGGGGMFDAGPQFVFNLGGGPGVRVHQFGGARPRRRPRDPNAPADPPANIRSSIASLLPILVLFIIPFLSSIFSGSDAPAGPRMRFDGPEPPHTLHRLTRNLKVDYWVNPVEVTDYSASKLSRLDQSAEVSYVQQLRVECEQQIDHRQRIRNDAQGWFFQDPDKMQQAREMEMRACKKLESLGVIARGSY